MFTLGSVSQQLRVPLKAFPLPEPCEVPLGKRLQRDEYPWRQRFYPGMHSPYPTALHEILAETASRGDSVIESALLSLQEHGGDS